MVATLPFTFCCAAHDAFLLRDALSQWESAVGGSQPIVFQESNLLVQNRRVRPTVRTHRIVNKEVRGCEYARARDRVTSGIT